MVNCRFHCSHIKVKKHLKAATKSTFFSLLSMNKFVLLVEIEHHCSTWPTKY